MKQKRVKLTKEQIEKMQSYLQDIVLERSSSIGEDDPEDQATDQDDMRSIACVKTVGAAIELLEYFRKDFQSELTVWTETLDPLGGFDNRL